MSSCAAAPFDARRWDALALAAIAMGTLLRTLGIGSEALWFDEVMSVEHLAGSTWEDVKGVLTRVDPPLYYAFLWAWIPLAGTSELALRLPSFLCGVAALVLIWRCGRAWFSPAVGAAAAALLAASPLAILYAQEARFYEPLLLCGLAACAAWDRLLLQDGGKRELWLYALAAAALFYLHFMGALLVAAHALFLVLGGLSREARRRGLRALVAAALLIGPYLLGVLYLYLGERAGHRDWIQRSGGTPATAQVLATLASFTGLQGPQLRVQRPWLELPALLLVGTALLRTLLALGERERPLPERQRLRLHGLSLVVPPLLLALLSQSKSIYLDRYLLAGLPSAVLLVAYGLGGSGEKRALRTCALVLATAAAVLLPFVTCWASLRKAAWPAALEELAREARTGDVLVIDGPVDRPERPSEGIDITTYHYYRRALETARGAAQPTRVVTLPFELLRRGEWSGVHESERAELERAREVERALLASEAATIWVAATLDPWRTPWPDRPLEQTTLWKQLVSRAGLARASTYPRLELWRFARTAAPSASGE